MFYIDKQNLSTMEKELEEYGLSQKEIKVYLACLKLGTSTANRISVSTDLRRSTTYDILESLKVKGLIASFIRDKKHYFQAAEPTDLLELLHQKEVSLKKIMPELEQLKAMTVEKPKVRLFEGTRGVTAMLEELYQEKELLIYGSAQKAFEGLKHIPESLAFRRAHLKIKARMIFERSEYAWYRIKDPQIKKVTEMRFLESMRKCPSVTWIGSNQVGIVTLDKELLGIHIVNKEIAQTQRLAFESFWLQAKN